MAKTVREVMTPVPACVRSSESVLEAAIRMAEVGAGSLPICGEDNKLKGLITDRDIVVKVIAAANDPRAVHVGELAQGEAVTVRADDSAEDDLATIRRHQVQRLPVIDGQKMIGIVALADVARVMSDPPGGALVEALSVDR